MPGRFMKFCIPDFALGALFMFIMASIAILLCVPELTGEWVWWALVSIGIIAWVIGAGLQETPSQISRGDKEEEYCRYKTRDKIDKPTISSDAAAIIDAINQQEWANREQECTEDNSKRRREIVTIFIISITGGAILWQVVEMRKVYGPISDQAKASLQQSSISIAGQRAWIVFGLTQVDPFVSGNPVTGKVSYGNVGREPATIAATYVVPHIFTNVEWTDGDALHIIVEDKQKCMSAPEPKYGSVIPPSPLVIGTGPYLSFFNTAGADGTYRDGFVADSSLAKEEKIFVVDTCFVYMTYGKVRHTASCFFHKKGVGAFNGLALCIGGDDAD